MDTWQLFPSALQVLMRCFFVFLAATNTLGSVSGKISNSTYRYIYLRDVIRWTCSINSQSIKPHFLLLLVIIRKLVTVRRLCCFPTNSKHHAQACMKDHALLHATPGVKICALLLAAAQFIYPEGTDGWVKPCTFSGSRTRTTSYERWWL